jgi:hypothetical protein
MTENMCWTALYRALRAVRHDVNEIRAIMEVTEKTKASIGPRWLSCTSMRVEWVGTSLVYCNILHEYASRMGRYHGLNLCV